MAFEPLCSNGFKSSNPTVVALWITCDGSLIWSIAILRPITEECRTQILQRHGTLLKAWHEGGSLAASCEELSCCEPFSKNLWIRRLWSWRSWHRRPAGVCSWLKIFRCRIGIVLMSGLWSRLQGRASNFKSQWGTSFKIFWDGLETPQSLLHAGESELISNSNHSYAVMWAGSDPVPLLNGQTWSTSRASDRVICVQMWTLAMQTTHTQMFCLVCVTFKVLWGKRIGRHCWSVFLPPNVSQSGESKAGKSQEDHTNLMRKASLAGDDRKFARPLEQEDLESFGDNEADGNW